MNRTCENKVVMISGGLGDIALATALAFGRAGAKIALGDIIESADGSERLEELKKKEVDFVYTRVDIRDPTAVTEWLSEVDARWGKVDIAIMNAAILQQKNIENLSMEAWKSIMEVNLNGAFYLAQQAAIYMKMRRIKGNLVFIGSWAGHAVHPNIPAYSVAKAAVRMLCQCMALEFAPFGIRVNELAPGYVNAGVSKQVWKKDPSAANKARQSVPVGYLIEPEEVAANILWICNESNRSLTGSTWLLDGGLSLLRP